MLLITLFMAAKTWENEFDWLQYVLWQFLLYLPIFVQTRRSALKSLTHLSLNDVLANDDSYQRVWSHLERGIVDALSEQDDQLLQVSWISEVLYLEFNISLNIQCSLLNSDYVNSEILSDRWLWSLLSPTLYIQGKFIIRANLVGPLEFELSWLHCT